MPPDPAALRRAARVARASGMRGELDASTLTLIAAIEAKHASSRPDRVGRVARDALAIGVSIALLTLLVVWPLASLPWPWR